MRETDVDDAVAHNRYRVFLQHYKTIQVCISMCCSNDFRNKFEKTKIEIKRLFYVYCD